MGNYQAEGEKRVFIFINFVPASCIISILLKMRQGFQEPKKLVEGPDNKVPDAHLSTFCFLLLLHLLFYHQSKGEKSQGGKRRNPHSKFTIWLVLLLCFLEKFKVCLCLHPFSIFFFSFCDKEQQVKSGNIVLWVFSHSLRASCREKYKIYS